MEVSDIFYLLGSILMSLLIILLVTLITFLFILKKKAGQIQAFITANIVGKITSVIFNALPFMKKKN